MSRGRADGAAPFHMSRPPGILPSLRGQGAMPFALTPAALRSGKGQDAPRAGLPIAAMIAIAITAPSALKTRSSAVLT